MSRTIPQARMVQICLYRSPARIRMRQLLGTHQGVHGTSAEMDTADVHRVASALLAFDPELAVRFLIPIKWISCMVTMQQR